MQYSSIELKSSKYVLTLVMDPEVSFEQILTDVTDKFKSSARFFRGAQMALEFKGRDLTDQQQRRVVRAIISSCSLDIICVLEETSAEKENAQYNAITDVLKNRPADSGQGHDDSELDIEDSADVIRTSVKNGQKFFSDRSVFILGDVEPMAEVSSSQSIFVAGQVMGTLRAGLDGDRKSYVAALVLKPRNLELCGHKSFTGIRKTTMDEAYPICPQIAFLDEGNLVVRNLSGKIWSRIFEKHQNASSQIAAASDPDGSAL